MKSDSTVRDEINRIHSPSVRGEFERMVLQDIIDHSQLTGAEYLNDPKKAIKDYWEKKLK